MFYSYKFRLCPNVSQQRKLANTFGCARFVWNKYVEQFNNKEKLKKISKLREEFPFLKQVSSHALGNDRLSFEATLKQFFNKKRKARINKPQFKSKNDNDSFSLDSRARIYGNTIQIEKVGRVKIIIDRPIIGRIFGVTVSRNKANQYFAAIKVEKEDFQPLPKTGKQIGLDVGLKYFVTFNDGQTIENPRYFVNNQDKIARLQLWLSKKTVGSTRFKKLKLRLAKQHLRVANRRKHFLHNLSAKIVRDFDFIAVEDLNIKGMIKNHKLAKAISDVSWGEFSRQLEYKSKWYGKTFQKIGRFEPTSKTCSNCGCIKDQFKLSERTYSCEHCDKVLDRDMNAAVNILNTALENHSAKQTLMEAEVGRPCETFNAIIEIPARFRVM
jgi:putative transposase